MIVETKEKLLPCPFCGEKNQKVELFNLPFKGRGYAVCCPDCGVMVWPSITPEVAEKRWNDRAIEQDGISE